MNWQTPIGYKEVTLHRPLAIAGKLRKTRKIGEAIIKKSASIQETFGGLSDQHERRASLGHYRLEPNGFPK
ncbi:hypothetical protein [Mariniblastus fucicola]|uniref:Uncharacterized protein n=1 Tax=Mariniblastus fucicola TaxID=980251 RepID=A0A5B9P923_9BACT|nr:hypothetical protein [Mariniblastus fucicola]QEG21390.1 hypothetical protein MFFC18_12460 [Mariniblastus fucicola]